ncbi:virion structural protein [Synechococcus phage S-CAM3]|uniref:Virion structural protein n=1 Tax=Synechococcus phage S-CAM3 TaxID=1883366 RepID=A0A1D8KK24_9CAUD|nr:virion structural protein [Synechococcus phage S-CAM3]AOV58534.1 hypothetical protein S250808_029 [Synechococcus phage S-CAM3]AOV59012.1 hypothetical protein C421010_029 [Synechococcus phage S-CAM3]
MPAFSNTYNVGSYTVSLPNRAFNIQLTVAGAQGGNGGSDSGAAGGTRGAGRKASFRLSQNNVARTLSFYIGSSGGNGYTGSSGAYGNGGSSAIASGGRGGSTGYIGTSGGGGAGGAPSGVYDSYAGTYIIVAGGGGGGGGGSYPGFRGGNASSAGSFSSSYRSISSGSSGSSNGYDGGGGGGGGGGASGGSGGSAGADRIRYSNPNTRTGSGNLNQKPSCTGVRNGWYTRTGGTESSGNSGVRRLQLIWGGSLIYDGSLNTDSNGYILIGGYAYKWGTYRGSTYGWAGDDSCGTKSPPSGDNCNGFDIIRYNYTPSSGFSSSGGSGGGSYDASSYVTYIGGEGLNYGNGYIYLSYDLSNPYFSSFTASPNTIIRGENVTFSWSTVYPEFIESIILQSPDSDEYNVTGTTNITLQPNRSGTWLITLYYRVGTAPNPGVLVGSSTSLAVTVYIPPTITLELDNNPMPLGQSSKLSWNVEGDVSSLNITPGIGDSNISSFANVSPTVTTTYTAVADGPAGTASEEITLTVWQPPELSLSGPTNVDYGNNVELIHSQTGSNASYILTITMTDLDDVVTTSTVDLGASQVTSQTTYTHVVPWGLRGPKYIDYKTTGVGDGGLTQDETLPRVVANIDERPDSFDLPESDGKIKEEAPVITPDVVLTSRQIVVDDIDIPVRIKADSPIQVEIDNDGIYRDVEQI